MNANNSITNMNDKIDSTMTSFQRFNRINERWKAFKRNGQTASTQKNKTGLIDSICITQQNLPDCNGSIYPNVENRWCLFRTNFVHYRFSLIFLFYFTFFAKNLSQMERGDSVFDEKIGIFVVKSKNCVCLRKFSNSYIVNKTVMWVVVGSTVRCEVK